MFTSKYRWMAAFGTSIACHVVVFVVIGVVVALFPSAPVDKGPIEVDLVSLSGGGGGGGGITISPVAFIVIQNDKVRMMQINNYSSSADRAIAMIPELVDQISQLVKAKDEPAQAEDKAE
mgnify:CR=1 FL=1